VSGKQDVVCPKCAEQEERELLASSHLLAAFQHDLSPHLCRAHRLVSKVLRDEWAPAVARGRPVPSRDWARVKERLRQSMEPGFQVGGGGTGGPRDWREL
jgi:hypothetical protein